MAIIYEDIGFMRKAAFFTRKAARHCTSQHLPPQGWTAVRNTINDHFQFQVTVSLSKDIFISVIQPDEKCFGWIQNSF